MGQTISKTFGMTLRIEVDPENEDLLVRYLDGRYIRGTMLDTASRMIGRGTGKGKHGAQVLFRAGRYEPSLSVDHLNGKPADNRLANLEWVTRKENVRRSRSKNPEVFALPPLPRNGLRLYPMQIEAIYDQQNEDLLDRLIKAYEKGSMYRGIMSSIASVDLAWAAEQRMSLTYQILRRNGISIPKGMTVDHINGDGGDNRLINLRVVTMSINHANKKNFNYPLALVA